MNLLPRPRQVTAGEGHVPVGAPAVTTDPSLPAEGYELDVGTAGISLRAADERGLFYGRATLAQLARLDPRGLPVCAIRDWPDLAVRGVMLDVSRDKVPSVATLQQLIARLASWKVNQVQLYLEHTFAYRDHRAVWEHASPYTAADIAALDAFCRDHHVELVPNQNCLGHMERWLRHDAYRPLAISVEGDGRRTTLEPSNPGALALVRSLLGELLPCFTSARVHVGLDEPWELPAERLDDYLGWVRALRALPELDGREMLMWGDVLGGRADVAAELPDGVTVCDWGYDDGHPFAERAATLAAAGRPFWLCPGTSSWLTILGRTTNMVANTRAAASAAIGHRGAGLLTTDWGDMGHLQYLPVSEPGFACAAAFSWCLDANAGIDLAAALDVHAFADPAGELGGALLALGDVHRTITPQVPNMASLVLPLYYPQVQLGRGPMKGITTAEIDAAAAALDDAAAALSRARPERADGALVLDELSCSIALVGLLCRDLRGRLAGDGTLGSIDAATRAALAADLDGLIERHRALWLARNRPGGLDDSCAWLRRLQGCYRTGDAAVT